MPQVAEAVVVAAPDARLGERAAAVLRLKAGHADADARRGARALRAGRRGPAEVARGAARGRRLPAHRERQGAEVSGPRRTFGEAANIATEQLVRIGFSQQDKECSHGPTFAPGRHAVSAVRRGQPPVRAAGGADQVPAEGVQGRRPVRARSTAAPRSRSRVRSATTSPTPPSRWSPSPARWEEYFKFGNPDGKSKRELFGEPMRAIPAFFEPGPRLEMMDELGLDRTLMFPTLASLIEERLRDDPVAIHVVVHSLNQWLRRGVGLQLPEPHLHHPGDHPADRREGDRGAGVGGQARRPRHPDPPGAGARVPRPAVVRAARVRPVLEAVRRVRRVRRHALHRQRLLPLHLRVGRRRPGDAAVPDQRHVDPQRVAPDPGRGGLLGDPRRAVPVPEAEGRHRRGRLEVDVPAAGLHGRGVQEGAGGLPGQPDRGDQEPHLRQPVLRGGHRRPDRPDRRRPGAVRLRLAAPGGPGRADPLRRPRSSTSPSRIRPRSWAATSVVSSRCDVR